MSDLLHSLEVITNVATYHREHEKYYARAPLQQALANQQIACVFTTLADRWSTIQANDPKPEHNYLGCEDLNDLSTIQYCGVLFMEGQGEPAEISGFKHRLKENMDETRRMGQWLHAAMQSAWQGALPLLQVPALASVLGERHRISLNVLQATNNVKLVTILLERALEILERVDFTPQAIRTDLAGPRIFPDYLYAAAELINRAADLASEAAVLTHDNERRWRVYRQRVEQVRKELA